MELHSLSPDYLVALSRQITFLGAFLGGFAAAMLATLLVADSSKRVAGWAIGCVAFSASAFVVAVVASVSLITVLHPSAPSIVAASAPITKLRVISAAAFGLGIYTLLASVGMSGWIRSARTGIATSLAALLAICLVSWIVGGAG